jgi:predicted Zn-dependent protease with MMP-like domain
LRRWDIPADEQLLGFYEGVPLTERTSDYGLIAPDVIYIFQKAIEAECPSDEEIQNEVRRTVRHEIAHHFGIEDERLEELDRY